MNTILTNKDYPTHYYNILPDLPEPLAPPLNPATKKPIGPQDLAPLFPMEIIKQEVSQERYIEIPEEVQELYKMYRPTPFLRARRLEKFLDTPAHIYFKNEGATFSGSHKINTAIAQAYFNKKEGTKKIATETGAGQWGSALSIACRFFDIKCEVYMVRISYDQKPYRKNVMQLFGSKIYSSPSNNTDFGKKILSENPKHIGSLGIAISEALERAVKNEDIKYSIGSVLNHVLLHQTIIGQEAKKQLEKMEENYPDVVIGCTGGGSNFAGFAYPFLADVLKGKKKEVRFIGTEPKACPSLTKGKYRYDFGDTAGITPLIKMYTLGHNFQPDPIHAGGLRYHGLAPSLSLLHKKGYVEAVSYSQKEVFEAGKIFSCSEGLIPAPESTHAIRSAIDEALKAKEEGKKKVIIFNLSGHGHFDMKGYGDFLEGRLK